MPISSANDQSSPLRIFIEPARRGSRGQSYRVRLGAADGPIIVEGSTDPEHAACRYLVAQGLKGKLEVWSAGRATPRMLIRSIEVAAGMSATDEDRKGVRLRKYQPPLSARTPAEDDAEHPSHEEASNDNAVSGEDTRAS